ncbi:Maintenance of ploidy protein mob2, partial [Coemansia sp. RSA 2703]
TSATNKSENDDTPSKKRKASTEILGKHTGEPAKNKADINTNRPAKRGEANDGPKVPFCRIRPEDVVYADERLKDNRYMAKGGVENDFGYKAHRDLIVTRGKGFTKEKNKKKRGSYSGGKITMVSHSINKLTGIGKQKQPNVPSSAAAKNQPPLFLRKNHALSHLVKGSFKGVVQLPKYTDLNEWLSINTFEFFNLVNMFYGVVTDFCTINGCPTMSAGPNTEYTWTDTQRKTIKLAAPQYIDYVLSQIQTTLDDER